MRIATLPWVLPAVHEVRVELTTAGFQPTALPLELLVRRVLGPRAVDWDQTSLIHRLQSRCIVIDASTAVLNLSSLKCIPVPSRRCWNSSTETTCFYCIVTNTEIYCD